MHKPLGNSAVWKPVQSTLRGYRACERYVCILARQWLSFPFCWLSHFLKMYPPCPPISPLPTPPPPRKERQMPLNFDISQQTLSLSCFHVWKGWFVAAIFLFLIDLEGGKDLREWILKMNEENWSSLSEVGLRGSGWGRFNKRHWCFKCTEMPSINNKWCGIEQMCQIELLQHMDLFIEGEKKAA